MSNHYLALIVWFLIWFVILRTVVRVYVAGLLKLSRLSEPSRTAAILAAYISFSLVAFIPILGPLLYRRMQHPDVLPIAWHAGTAFGLCCCLVPVFFHIFKERIGDLRAAGLFR